MYFSEEHIGVLKQSNMFIGLIYLKLVEIKQTFVTDDTGKSSLYPKNAYVELAAMAYYQNFKMSKLLRTANIHMHNRFLSRHDIDGLIFFSNNGN